MTAVSLTELSSIKFDVESVRELSLREIAQG